MSKTKSEPKKLAIKCKNAKQKEFLKTIESHEVTICTAPAGVGKTYLACYQALKMLENHQVDKIVLVKSVITIPEESLGYVPGSISEKMDPFMISFFGNIDKLIGEGMRKQLVAEGKILI